MSTRYSALLLVVVFTTLIILGYSTPAQAQGPLIEEEVWTGHIWQPTPLVTKTFTAPENVDQAKVYADWMWSGHPGQNQLNETHTVHLPNGLTISCPDFGDEEFDQNGDGLGEVWVSCASPVAFGWSDDLPIEVIFTGDNSSPGSHLFRVRVQWFAPEPQPPVCHSVDLSIPNGSTIPEEGTEIDVMVNASNASQYQLIIAEDEDLPPIGLPQPHSQFNNTFVLPNITYQVQVSNGTGEWITTESCQFHFKQKSEPKSGVNGLLKIDQKEQPLARAKFELLDLPTWVTIIEASLTSDDAGVIWAKVHWEKAQSQVTGRFCEVEPPPGFTLPSEPCVAVAFKDGEQSLPDDLVKVVNTPITTIPSLICTLIPSENHIYMLDVTNDEKEIAVPITAWLAESNFGFNIPETSINQLPIQVPFPNKPGDYWVQFSVQVDGHWLGGDTCHIQHRVNKPPPVTGQYQDFIGAVPFGTFTPYLELGKEYFDGVRSIMLNAEYITEAGQADIVYRFNGQEISDVTTSIFHDNTFSQIHSSGGRAVTRLNNGVTKLISYRFGVEQAHIFQTIRGANTRWIHPLNQPFEHQYSFKLELHGPPNVTDLLVYHNHRQAVTYNENGVAIVTLTYSRPDLVAIYQTTDGLTVSNWSTVEVLTPAAPGASLTYHFRETGLYHYALVNPSGQFVAGPSQNPLLALSPQPGLTYLAQLAYPETALFVGLYDDMQFEPPAFWTMPIDANQEHHHEYHIDYHRNKSGDVVIDALYLLNATTSVAQQFPYGRHDDSLPGVTIVGIPDVSLIAFCQRPGYHEVSYWGGWENESYYLPDRSWIYDEEVAQEWGTEQRNDCVDAAHRINQELARQGLRTDHTYRHHGEHSQGYQLIQHNAWSPYNLVGMRPPHVGKILKTGTVLRYTHDAKESLFWGWDLHQGGLRYGLGRVELQQYVNSLEPVEYIDQTGIHPPEMFNNR